MKELETLVTNVNLASERAGIGTQYSKDKGYEGDW